KVRHRLATDLEDRCDLAVEVAGVVSAGPRLSLLRPPVLSTVVFRPAHADSDAVAELSARTGLVRVRAEGAEGLKLAVSDRVEDLRLLEVCSLSAMSTHSD